MRPIDADKLQLEGYLECFDEKCTERDLAFLNMMVEKMPTVDAVPVIRCKDCKWWNGYYSCIRTASDDFDENDYCSLAEREEE